MLEGQFQVLRYLQQPSGALSYWGPAVCVTSPSHRQAEASSPPSPDLTLLSTSDHEAADYPRHCEQALRSCSPTKHFQQHQRTLGLLLCLTPNAPAVKVSRHANCTNGCAAVIKSSENDHGHHSALFVSIQPCMQFGRLFFIRR